MTGVDSTEERAWHRGFDTARRYPAPGTVTMPADVAMWLTAGRCDRRCREAFGDDCECSCLGSHHGGGLWGGDWIEVGETTLVRPGWQVRHMRLIRDTHNQ